MAAFCSAVNVRRFFFVAMWDSSWLRIMEPVGVTFQLNRNTPSGNLTRVYQYFPALPFFFQNP